MTGGKIVVYGTKWCVDCQRTQRFFNDHRIEFEFINIDADKNGESFVLKTNRGMRSVPTIVFSDGTILVEPSNVVLAKKLQIA